MIPGEQAYSLLEGIAPMRLPSGVTTSKKRCKWATS